MRFVDASVGGAGGGETALGAIVVIVGDRSWCWCLLCPCEAPSDAVSLDWQSKGGDKSETRGYHERTTKG